MNEGPTSPAGKSILAHAVTVLVTLALVLALFGDRPGVRRRSPLVQIPAVVPQPDPPLPQPVSPTFVSSPRQIDDDQTPAPPTDVLKDLDPDERKNVMVYAAANKSVVNITTESEASGIFGDETSTGTGSGFIIDKQGHVLTNFHVVQGANSRIRVRLFDGSAHEGQVIGFDASNDVAVLMIRVPADKLFPLSFGDSSKVMVGQKILALGNPFGQPGADIDLRDRQQPRGVRSRPRTGGRSKGIIQT